LTCSDAPDKFGLRNPHLSTTLFFECRPKIFFG
jgi:hypothetical protein